MGRKEVNESSSFLEQGMCFCVVCKSPKDDTRDDCGCMWDFPLKYGEY